MIERHKSVNVEEFKRRCGHDYNFTKTTDNMLLRFEQLCIESYNKKIEELNEEIKRLFNNETELIDHCKSIDERIDMAITHTSCFTDKVKNQKTEMFSKAFVLDVLEASVKEIQSIKGDENEERRLL